MRINTNVDAMRAYSNYATWNASKSKSLLRISSGKRINSFADDPAGACIAVKMGAQVSGLKVAKRNAQDGISLIQTAEGALNETHSILGRMRDLAVQAANGTLTYEDRAAIDKEFQALRQEINRIGNSSQFNTINLLDGSRNKITLQVGANAGQTMDVELSDMRFDAIFKTTNGKLSVTDANGQTVDVEMGLCGSKETIKKHNDAKDAYNAAANSLALAKAKGQNTSALEQEVAAKKAAFEKVGQDLNREGQNYATIVMNQVDKAISTVSLQRAGLGATQNALQHTINYLENSAINLSDAQSRIEDCDIAEEMMNFTKANLMSQVAAAMLAQANSEPNTVLTLLNSLPKANAF